VAQEVKVKDGLKNAKLALTASFSWIREMGSSWNSEMLPPVVLHVAPVHMLQVEGELVTHKQYGRPHGAEGSKL